MDRLRTGGSQVFASKDTVLLGGQKSTIELRVYGTALHEFRWKALLASENGEAGEKSELTGTAENIVAGRWNRVTIQLGVAAGKYLRYVSLFANPKNTNPDVFYVDEVRWVN